MAHDASKVLLGQTPSSIKEIDNMAGDPATFKAGMVVHLKNDGTLSLASSDGSKLGVSLGASLSKTKRVPICRKGLKVPVLLTAELTPVVGAQVHISNTTGLAAASGAGATAVNASYASGVLTGIAEDGTEVDCALIDMPGGL